ncbi:3-hydroxyacyl-CoA dehydrogenase family protein [Nocardia sp. NPDC051570]|uniref:3-hydroxyacyl-CoA dehydrogenase family protein n=1 Tax=Nocardia sp. NPDC051570 TaxID=3364324 RepID=UPI0037A53F0D
MNVPADYPERPVAVIGAGERGRAIAMMFATHGGLVRIHDIDAHHGAEAVEFATAHPESPRGRVEFTAELTEATDGAWLVVESIPERLERKQALFARLESVSAPDTILATDSAYASRAIVAGLSSTGRMLNIHFTAPAHSATVEVMSCGDTSQRVLDFLMAALPAYGLHPFLVRRESMGFVVDRIWAAITREALDIVAEGIATPADIDDLLRHNLAATVAPFRAMDTAGLDTVYDTEAHYAAGNPNLSSAPRQLLRRYIDSGKLGEKSGAGFYSDYPRPEAAEATGAELPVDGGASQP